MTVLLVGWRLIAGTCSVRNGTLNLVRREIDTAGCGGNRIDSVQTVTWPQGNRQAAGCMLI
jgi:hypothetical protein